MVRGNHSDPLEIQIWPLKQVQIHHRIEPYMNDFQQHLNLNDDRKIKYRTGNDDENETANVDDCFCKWKIHHVGERFFLKLRLSMIAVVESLTQ
uniref:Uncharacterized protein n=1 Tax=Romanomermis culicivorax TaxID=13658 RepID=A0A915IAF9_ROMCU